MLLEVKDIYAGANDREILKDLSLEVGEGEIHVIMGPNGSGKSTLAHVIMNTGGYEINSGKIFFEGEDITELETDKRARLGLFMSYQAPPEIPGVTLENFIRAAITARDGETPGFFDLRDKIEEIMDQLHINTDYKERYVNVGFSGGERKKSEILQLLMLEPKLAILDETDSGLDVDAVEVVGKGIAKFMEKKSRSLIVITHHQEILKYVKPDFVHVIVDGKIVSTGKADLINRIEKEGFAQFRG